MEEGDGRNTGSPSWWRGTRQPTAREGQVGPARVAERPILPVKPGNAGGGKGPQVRSDAQREKGLGSGYAYYPERRPENPTASHAQVKEPRSKGAGLSRRQQARRPTGRAARRRAEAVPLPQVRSPVARGCQGVPCARRMIPLESRMREIRLSGSESGDWKRSHGEE